MSFVTAQAQLPDHILEGALIDGQTIIKGDLMGPIFRNFDFSVERVLAKRMSINLSFRFMPMGKIPFLPVFKKTFGDFEGYLDNLKMKTLALTPEVRIYLGEEGYGKGIYVAPYYHYLTLDPGDYHLEGNFFEGKNEKLTLKGALTTHSGGLMIGYQWMLGAKKNFLIDWGIFGLHYGNSSGVFNGNTTYTMTQEDQAEVKKQINEKLSQISQFTFTTEISPHSATVTEKGPWLFFRSYFSIGWRF